VTDVNRIPLSQADPCGGCGKCCHAIGLPPFEAANPEFGPQKVVTRGMTASQIDTAAFDTELFLFMPEELRLAHAELLLNLTADPSGSPCVWYDTDADRCRHYDWRPGICRKFLPDSDECVKLRAEPNAVLVWQDDNTPERWRNPRRTAERGTRNRE
jgi:Fe-S-cluster containining protein